MTEPTRTNRPKKATNAATSSRYQAATPLRASNKTAPSSVEPGGWASRLQLDYGMDAPGEESQENWAGF